MGGTHSLHLDTTEETVGLPRGSASTGWRETLRLPAGPAESRALPAPAPARPPRTGERGPDPAWLTRGSPAMHLPPPSPKKVCCICTLLFVPDLGMYTDTNTWNHKPGRSLRQHRAAADSPELPALPPTWSCYHPTALVSQARAQKVLGAAGNHSATKLQNGGQDEEADLALTSL